MPRGAIRFPQPSPKLPLAAGAHFCIGTTVTKSQKLFYICTKCTVQIQRQEIFLMATAASHLESRSLNLENIYHTYSMSQFFVKYGEKCCLTLPPFTNISEKIIYFVALCVSPQARKGPTGDCLMIVGSCIKYTAAGGERREHIHAGCWGGGRATAWVQSVRKTQNVWVLRLGVKSVMDAEHESFLLGLKRSDLCPSCRACDVMSVNAFR